MEKRKIKKMKKKLRDITSGGKARGNIRDDKMDSSLSEKKEEK